MVLVLHILDPVFHGEWVPEDVENLEVLELCSFLGSFAEVVYHLFECFDLVVADGEDVEFGAVAETVENLDSVVVEGEVG